jgi:hypothetical protein
LQWLLQQPHLAEMGKPPELSGSRVSNRVRQLHCDTLRRPGLGPRPNKQIAGTVDGALWEEKRQDRVPTVTNGGHPHKVDWLRNNKTRFDKIIHSSARHSDGQVTEHEIIKWIVMMLLFAMWLPKPKLHIRANLEQCKPAKPWQRRTGSVCFHCCKKFSCPLALVMG